MKDHDKKFEIPKWCEQSSSIDKFYGELVVYVAEVLADRLSLSFESIFELFVDINKQNYIHDPATVVRLKHNKDYERLGNNSDRAEVDDSLVIEGIKFPIDENSSYKFNFFATLSFVKFKNCQFINVDNSKLKIDLEYLFFQFEDCNFNTKIELFSYFNNDEWQAWFFNSCTFEKEVSIHQYSLPNYDEATEPDFNYIKIENIFSNCNFYDQLSISGSFRNLPLFCHDSKSSVKKLLFSELNVLEETKLHITVDLLQIEYSDFNDLVDFSNSEIREMKLKNTTFKQSISFQSCILGIKNYEKALIKFSYVNFNKFSNFRDVNFLSGIDLVNNTFFSHPNFLNAAFNKQAQISTDRETFRIIKHSFDAVGNHIEANKYFAYEMEAYRRELKTEKGNYKERMLLWFNSLISNHGQNYIKASTWWFGLVGYIGLVLAIDSGRFSRSQDLLAVLYSRMPEVWFQFVEILNALALGFLPFSVIYKNNEHLAAFLLLSSLLLAGITWHALVAVRRHSKR